jgi:hypothetical protein
MWWYFWKKALVRVKNLADSSAPTMALQKNLADSSAPMMALSKN